MKKAQKAEKRPSGPQADGSQKEFETTFKPGGGRVNFGKAKNEGAPKVKKKGKGPKKILILLLAVILVLGAAAATLYFLGFLNPVLEMAGLVPPAAEPGLSLEEREALVAIREKDLTSKEASLARREEDLAARIAELEAEQAAQALGGGEQSFQETLQGISAEKLTDVKKVSSIYSKMDPAEAASILEDMHSRMETCLILYHMQPAASAMVMERMEAGTAAELTQIMLS